MTKIFILLLLLLALTSYSSILAQDSLDCVEPRIKESKYILGLKGTGIGFGPFQRLNGINLSLTDKSCNINGLSISLIHNFESYKTINGIDITGLGYVETCNGISLNLAGEIDDQNGIAASLIYGNTWYANGLQISGLAHINENRASGLMIVGLYGVNTVFNGLAISPGYLVSDSLDRGFIISGIMYSAETSVGVSISGLNKTNRSKGVQIGLINISQNHSGVQLGVLNVNHKNPKLLRYLPIINANFRRKN